MKARIISKSYGINEIRISTTVYEVVERNEEKSILIVGENYDGKPIKQIMNNDEVLILDKEKCNCGNDIEIVCPECGKEQCWNCMSNGYYPSDYKYCECGCPIDM